ncbi:DUF4229 domain-containing protein [Agromyces atrinae]|uniref:DUF4229 domain-containing protein n=1 Tax=Agromyces atrinae TaxID=592376 RepID=UPI001F56144F|nr:DUF4229 domain-containing protein [Agromyces atrinae]MCI2957295.1 DUF4229 domain-containing protein [Agromyces atrinae]
MKSVPVWVYYTALRIVLFAAPLAILLIAGVEPWVSALVAALFGFSTSFIFLRRPREAMSQELYDARHRSQTVPHVDDDAEDAAIDAEQQAKTDEQRSNGS